MNEAVTAWSDERETVTILFEKQVRVQVPKYAEQTGSTIDNK